MHNLESYCVQLERELRLLPLEKRRQIIARLKDDLHLQMEEQGEGEAQFCLSLPKPEEMAAEFLSSPELKPSGILERALALVVDFAIVLVPLFGLILLIKLFSGGGIMFGVLAGLTVLSLVGTTVLYFPVLEGTWGQTVGKALFGISVVRENGRPITYGQAFIRRLSFWCSLFLIDGLFSFFLPMNQRALDRVAGTVVVKNGRGKPWLIVLSMLLVLAMALGSISALAGITLPTWFYPDVPTVPTAGSDPERIVRELDLSEFAFVLDGLSPQERAVETLWQSPGGELRILAYYGDDGNDFLKAWSRADRVKTRSLYHTLGEKTLHRYRTPDMHKMGWRLGKWAFVVEASRDQFSPDEFKELIDFISSQLELM